MIADVMRANGAKEHTAEFVEMELDRLNNLADEEAPPKPEIVTKSCIEGNSDFETKFSAFCFQQIAALGEAHRAEIHRTMEAIRRETNVIGSTATKAITDVRFRADTAAPYHGSDDKIHPIPWSNKSQAPESRVSQTTEGIESCRPMRDVGTTAQQANDKGMELDANSQPNGPSSGSQQTSDDELRNCILHGTGTPGGIPCQSRHEPTNLFSPRPKPKMPGLVSSQYKGESSNT